MSVRALLLSDIHGDIENLEAAIRVGLSNKIDIILIAGDFTTTDIWPVVEGCQEKERDILIKKGYYPITVSADEHERFVSTVKKIGKVEKVDKEDIKWVESLIEKYRKKKSFKQFQRHNFLRIIATFSKFKKKPVYYVLGESDPLGVEYIIKDSLDSNHFINLQKKLVIFRNIALTGVGRGIGRPQGVPVSILPWRSVYLNMISYYVTQGEDKNYHTENEIGNILSYALRQGEERIGDRHLIIVSHVPPFRSGADISIIRDYSEKDKFSVFFSGSSALRKVIDIKNPTAVITGHVHSCAGITKIGETYVINPGQLKQMKAPIINIRSYRDRVAKEYMPVERWRATGSTAAILEIGRKISARQIEV